MSYIIKKWAKIKLVKPIIGKEFYIRGVGDHQFGASSKLHYDAEGNTYLHVCFCPTESGTFEATLYFHDRTYRNGVPYISKKPRYKVNLSGKISAFNYTTYSLDYDEDTYDPIYFSQYKFKEDIGSLTKKTYDTIRFSTNDTSIIDHFTGYGIQMNTNLPVNSLTSMSLIESDCVGDTYVVIKFEIGEYPYTIICKVVDNDSYLEFQIYKYGPAGSYTQDNIWSSDESTITIADFWPTEGA